MMIERSAGATHSLPNAAVRQLINSPYANDYTAGYWCSTHISSVADCQTAASALGINWAGPVTSPLYPTGCYMSGNNVNFNGATPVFGLHRVFAIFRLLKSPHTRWRQLQQLLPSVMTPREIT